MHLHLVLDAVESFPGHHRFIDGHPGTQLKIHFEVLVQFDLIRLGGVPDVRDRQPVFPGGQGDGIKSEGIGARSGLYRFAPKRRSEKHLTAGCILHVAAELVRLSLGSNRYQGQK